MMHDDSTHTDKESGEGEVVFDGHTESAAHVFASGPDVGAGGAEERADDHGRV